MAKRTPRMAAPAAEQEAADHGMAILSVPEGGTGCSFDGVEYEAEDGFVTVPQEAVADLLDHGFEVA